MTKKEFFSRDNSCFFFDRPQEIAKYCKDNFPEDCAHIIRVADEVCNKYFLFDLKCDMERTYEPVIFEDKIVWDYMPKDDPEFIWQFNRHRFFICLGQAYQLTGNEKYAECFAELLSNWIDTVPIREDNKMTTWRILETGIRGENWTKAFRYFKDSKIMTDELVDKFYQCLLVHADYIVSMHSPYRLISNWGVIENHGLFEIALSIPWDKKAEEYARIALEHLETECRMQIMEDGVQWEQSPMYHNEVLHCYLDVMTLAYRNNFKLPVSIKERVYKMLIADVAWIKPDHHQFLMGDSDDTDIRDIISIGAYLYRDPVLKYMGFKKLDFESVWELGLSANEVYEKMEEKSPEFTSISLADSGNHYLRSNWSEKANLLHFHCGTIGAGHGHSDQLHIDLVVNGEDVLMDSGRYNYVSGPNRFEFKDPTGHNTITVDGKLFTICKDSWECSKLSQPVKQQARLSEEYEFLQAGHLGYMDLPEGVFVNRKIVHIKPDIYIMMDEMYTSGEHSYQQYFHFNNKGTIEVTKESVSYLGEMAQEEFHFLTDDIKIEETKTRISRNYNQAEENTSIIVHKDGKGFQSLLTVIVPHISESCGKFNIKKIPVSSALKGIVYPNAMAEAVKIDRNGEEYVVIICHQEINSPTDLVEADGCVGVGNVIVFDKKKMTEVGKVLCY